MCFDTIHSISVFLFFRRCKDTEFYRNYQTFSKKIPFYK
nr:MAG TPA: hypothetical protein [Caudoviricetes sp.]